MTSQRFNLLFFMIVAASALLYGGLNPEYQTGVFNDDAEYVIAAHDMWATRPNAMNPLLQARPDFPFPGLPLLLAPLVKIVEPRWTLMEWLSVLMTTLSVFLFGRWLRKWMSPVETLVLVALFAFNPTVAKFSGVLMPAPYFITAILASYLLLHDLLEKPSPPKALALGLVLGWGSLIRPEGFLLLVCVPAALLFYGRWKDVGRVLVVPALCWLLFAAQWANQNPSLGTEYGGDLTALRMYWPSHLLEILRFSGHLWRVLLMNTLMGFRLQPNGVSSFARLWVPSLCGFVMAVGIYCLWKSEHHLRGLWISMAVFFGLYFAVHVFWHVAIPRYCVILVPFALIFLSSGLNELLALSSRRKLWLFSIVSLIVLSYGYSNGFAIHESLWAQNPLYVPPWRSMDWLRQNTPVSAQVLSPIAPSIVLYSNRSAVSILKASNEEDFLHLLIARHLDYIVDRPVKAISSHLSDSDDLNTDWNRIRRWVRLSPKRYSLVFLDPIEKVSVYRVSPEPGFFRAYETYVSAVQDLQRGRYDSAIVQLQNDLAAFPTLGSANNALGVVWQFRGNMKAAEKAFLNAVTYLPDSPAAFLNLASLYYLQGQRSRSDVYLTKALEVSSANAERQDFFQKVRDLQNHHEIDVPPNFPTS